MMKVFKETKWQVTLHYPSLELTQEQIGMYPNRIFDQGSRMLHVLTPSPFAPFFFYMRVVSPVLKDWPSIRPQR